jgi:hypothetical protein
MSSEGADALKLLVEMLEPTNAPRAKPWQVEQRQNRSIHKLLWQLLVLANG